MISKQLATATKVQNYIFMIRKHRVMLSPHLAELYGVEVRALIQAIKRNQTRFPHDFMFQLTPKEFNNLKSQFVISSWGGMRRALPYAFTEQGVAMLSSVLRSKKAIAINIAIMRAFVQLREMLQGNKQLAAKLAELEAKLENQGKDIHVLFDAMRQLMAPPPIPPKPAIGFKP